MQLPIAGKVQNQKYCTVYQHLPISQNFQLRDCFRSLKFYKIMCYKASVFHSFKLRYNIYYISLEKVTIQCLALSVQWRSLSIS